MQTWYMYYLYSLQAPLECHACASVRHMLDQNFDLLTKNLPGELVIQMNGLLGKICFSLSRMLLFSLELKLTKKYFKKRKF